MTPNTNHAFISYGHRDRPLVNFIAADLRATQVQLWVDEVEILPGDSLIGKISSGLKDAHYVLACLSKHSVRSNWVQTELEIAATKGIREKRVVVLPLLISPFDLNNTPFFLSHLLYVDCRQGGDYDESLTTLVRRLAPGQLTFDEERLVSPLHSTVLTIDATRAQKLVGLAAQGLHKWVVEYLVRAIERRDPVERHWTYRALTQLGGPSAAAALQKGKTDEDRFARLGAKA